MSKNHQVACQRSTDDESDFECVPPRVDVAMDFCGHIGARMASDEWSPGKDTLTPAEVATYESCLAQIRAFVNGESDGKVIHGTK